MPIITISRGSASGGMALAEGLCKRLDYELVTRESVCSQAASFAVSAETLEQALLMPVGFWDRFRHDRRRYLAFVQAALCERARNDRIVYVGHAGHFLLEGVAHVLCVLVVAPLDLRLRMVMERQHVGQDEAARYVERMDRHRREWTRFLYAVDWHDPGLYDLVVNLRLLDVESAVDVVSTAALSEPLQPTGASRRSMANLLVASRVRAALAGDPGTASVEIGVEADGDVVRLQGRVRPLSMVDAVVRIARSVEGVRDVDARDLGSPGYTV
jgi:cytidylate kinase